MQRLKAVQTAVVEGNWNLAQHLELIPTTGSNAVTQAEFRAAQRTQLGQMRLQQGGKSGGKRSIRVPPKGLGPGGGMASPSFCRPLPKAGASTLRSLKGGRKSHWSSSRRRQAKVWLRLPVPTPKSLLPLQKARRRSSPVHRLERQLTRTCRGALWREVKLAKSSPVRLQLPGRPMLLGRWRFAVLTQKHRWTRGSVSEKSEERKIPQRRSPWRDMKKSQRGTSASR